MSANHLTILKPRLLCALSIIFMTAQVAEIYATRDSDGRWIHGWPEENPFVEFVGGEGPGDCSEMGLPNYWINTSNRALVIRDPVFAYSGLGPDLEFAVSFNSSGNPACQADWGSRRDHRWREPYQSEIWINTDEFWRNSFLGKSINIVKPSGQVVSFRIPEGAEFPYEADPFWGVFDRLTVDEMECRYYEKKTRLVYVYEAAEYPYQETCSSENPYYRLVKIVDPYNQTVTLTYGAGGGVAQVQDAAGRTTTFQRDENGHLVRLTAPDGRQAGFEFNEYGDLLRTVDFAGLESVYTYEAPEEPHQATGLTSITTEGKTARFTWADAGRIETVEDAGGNTTSWWWNSGDYGRTDPEGGDWEYFHDSDKGLTRGVLQPNGHHASFRFYNEQNLPRWMTERRGYDGDYGYERGLRTNFEWDEQGNLIRTTQQDMSYSAPDRISTFSYDADSHLLSRTDPLGQTWTYEWNDQHRLTKVRTPGGGETTYSYDSLGNLTRITTPTGARTVLTYDTYGNLLTSTDPLGHTTRYSYDSAGLRLVETTDARGNTTQYTYDANNRLRSLVHPDGSTQSYDYDCCSGVSSTDERGNTRSFVRDPRQNIIQTIDALGHSTHLSYDGNRNLTSITDPLGNQWTRSYTATHRLEEVTDPSGAKVRYEYDEGGSPLSIEDPNGNRTTFQYTYTGMVKGLTDARGSEVSFEHDALDRVTRKTNARGQEVSLDYSADGYVSEKRLESEQATSYAYDDAGNLVEVKDAWGTTRIRVNKRDEVVQMHYPSGLSASFKYDPNGNLRSLTYPGNFTADYTYDSRNRPTRISWEGGSVDLGYDATGNLTSMTRSNGTMSAFGYDKNNRLIALRHLTGDEPWTDLQLVRDGAGNTTEEDRMTPLRPQLKSEQVPVAVASANQLEQIGEATVSHDADGNLTRRGARLAARYDAENRLVEVTRDGVTTTYAYDGLGNRYLAERGIWKRYFHYGPAGDLLFETDDEGRVTVLYIYAGHRLLVRRVEEEDSFYHFDARGSTLGLTDREGALVATYLYAPFGRVLQQSGSLYNPFTYVGAYGVMDEGDGLYFMKNRYYDSLAQRFLQKDPFGFLDGPNLYRYGANNPIDHVDPQGTFVIEALVVISAGATLVSGYYSWNNFFNEAKEADKSAEQWKRAQKGYLRGKLNETQLRAYRDQYLKDLNRAGRAGGKAAVKQYIDLTQAVGTTVGNVPQKVGLAIDAGKIVCGAP